MSLGGGGEGEREEGGFPKSIQSITWDVEDGDGDGLMDKLHHQF